MLLKSLLRSEIKTRAQISISIIEEGLLHSKNGGEGEGKYRINTRCGLQQQCNGKEGDDNDGGK